MTGRWLFQKKIGFITELKSYICNKTACEALGSEHPGGEVPGLRQAEVIGYRNQEARAPRSARGREIINNDKENQ